MYFRYVICGVLRQTRTNVENIVYGKAKKCMFQYIKVF